MINNVMNTTIKSNTELVLKRDLKQRRNVRMRKNIQNGSKGITLIALVITIVLNCSYLAMERRLKTVNILNI